MLVEILRQVYRPSRRSLFAACAITICLPFEATFAQDNASKEESIFLDDIPVILSASRLSQPINEAPVAVTIIDRQMIKDSGAWDLSEVFRLVPGMYVAYHADPYFSADSTVAYHGMVTTTTSDRMQVLIDGRSVYSSLFGGVNWSDLPIVLDDIERIEVIRGPDSASYGANSYSGVINIITRHPAESQGASVSLSEGPGRSEGVFRYAGKEGALSYRLSASARHDKGEADLVERPTSLFKFWTLNKYDNKTIQNFTLRTDYQVNADDTLEFQFGYNGGPRQVGEYGNVSAVRRQAENHFEMLHWRRVLDNGGELSVQAFHTVERVSATLQDSDGYSNGDATLRRFDLEVQHTFSPFKNTRLVWGGSVRYDQTTAPYYLGVGDNQYLFGDFPYHLRRAFANAEWRATPDLVLNIGGMAENNTYTGTDITPRIAANWHFQPGHTLRLSHSRATRSPSAYEKVYEGYWRGADFYPDLPILRPERVRSTEIGYMGKIGKIDVDMRLFNDDYSDLIDVRNQLSPASGNLNAGSAMMRGYEMQIKTPIGDNTRVIYGLSGGRVNSNNVNGVIYSDSLPQYSHSLMISHDFNARLRGSVVAYQVARTKFNATDYNPSQNRYYFIDANKRIDARLGYQFNLGNTRAELALIVQNLANAHYFEYRHDNELPGRLARLNLKLDF
ncbi:TonB-dependent receptor plug domain-containing protein [Undibacterium sp. SXout7W]|uniref:TonB-dependent receptor plug domain-containing protein n=1 Tax=Undibacterium sp. SXout7W TaxID=3413049 RepID=UPI003BF08B42